MRPLLAVALVSLPLFACGGEAHDAPAPITAPPPTVTAPVAFVDAAPPSPLEINVSVVDRSVGTRLAVPAPVPIDAAALTLPPALRAIVAHHLADRASIESLSKRVWKATGAEGACDAQPCPDAAGLRLATAAAHDALAKAVASYEASATTGIAALTAACDDPDRATTDIALASALLLRTNHDIVHREDKYSERCTQDVVDDGALHLCGTTDPRLTHAFARAMALSAPSDPLGVAARRGVAQTASAAIGRAALEPLVAAVTGAERIDVLQDLAVAYASGPSPDYEAAARMTRELLSLLDQAQQANPKPPSKPWPPPESGPVIRLASATPEPPTLYLSPRRPLDTAVLLLFALSRTGRDRDTVDAAIDLSVRRAELLDGVATLAADAIERSDDAEIAKAPVALQRAVFELLATRALYRGELADARQWATRADALGESGRAHDILAVAAKYGDLPEAPPPSSDHATRLDPDDFHAATTASAHPGRRIASIFRLCTEPFAGRLGDHPHMTLTVAPHDDAGAPAIEIAGNLPAPVGDCMRRRAVPALMTLPQGVVANVTLAP